MPITQTLNFKVLKSCSYCCSCSCMVTRSQNIIRSYLLSISDTDEVRCLILKDNTQPSLSVMTLLYLLPHHQTTEQSVRIRNSNFALQPWCCKMTIRWTSDLWPPPFCFWSFLYPSSISQTTGVESQARMEQIQRIQAELESLTHHISTLGQQIDQYQHACSRAKEEQGKMR